MHKYEKYFKKVYDVDIIYNNQDVVFRHYLGYAPNNNIRLRSPFRFDETPGCRFSYFKGKWWFIDNATYKGKLAFDCIQLVMYMFDISYKEAIQDILLKVKLDHSIVKLDSKDTFKPIIKFKPKKFDPDNYFTNNFKYTEEELKKHRCFLVESYWANTKKDFSLRYNCIGNPKEEEIFAFYFPSKNIKLYFPNRDSHKFFTNCNYNDYFGYNQEFDYNKSLIITKSGKDQMLLSRYYSNVIATQAETVSEIPLNLKTLIEKFNHIIIWFDNDYTGYKYSEIFKKLITEELKKEVTVINHPQYLEKDVSDMYLANQLENYIKHEFDRKVRNKS